ncbi:MAG: serine--tRNA ligase [Schleiferiaceae bacterium]|jgi:seryl-tRNA synthetase|nr:serine--tRNA ligase [Schleiferiaceae bacterium]
MLQINRIREEKENVIAALAKRHFDAKEIIDQLLVVNDEKKSVQRNAEDLQAESNGLAKQIGGLFKQGKREEAEELKARSVAIREELKGIQENLNTLAAKENDLLVSLPNTPHESVATGKNEQDNVEVKRVGEIPEMASNAKPHWEITSEYGLIDFELGVKITGAGFPVYTNKGARLQRALINYFLDKNTNAGFKEFIPPLFVNEASGFGTGQLPDKEGQMYHMPLDNLYAIPTAEVPITNLFRNEIVKKEELPIKCTAYTPCFRREAGSYGKDVRGLNRLHQFDKVEVVCVTEPEKSYAMLDEMVNHVAGLLDELGLPYRILRLCGGDMGFTSALTYDFEVYSAAQERWLEVSSVSNFENFQTNRLKLRYRDENKKTKLCHTLNGSALALPRIMAALLENNQTENGVTIPECLVPYTGFDKID